MSVPVVSTSLDACAICMDVLQKEDKMMSCHHIFHEACINEWFKTANTCPLCRYIFTEITPTIKHPEEMNDEELRAVPDYHPHPFAVHAQPIDEEVRRVRQLISSEDPGVARTMLGIERLYRLSETLERVAQMEDALDEMRAIVESDINRRPQEERHFEENQQVPQRQHPGRVRRLARQVGKIFHRARV